VTVNESDTDASLQAYPERLESWTGWQGTTPVEWRRNNTILGGEEGHVCPADEKANRGEHRVPASMAEGSSHH
jgi:hypothetical protein